ncbi:MAG TPA: transposase [Chryseobacterium sp.]|nr:transposase [Chryseobacterium sp.]
MDFKNIHIGSLIKNQIDKSEISDSRISSFFNISIDHVKEMYLQQHLSTELLLKWSKLLEYDFFRIYSQHLILFSPPANTNYKTVKNKNLPVFRKNVYTTEIILDNNILVYTKLIKQHFNT